MLSIDRIDVFRGETQILWDVSLEIQAGERVAILGSNGAGKSTLIQTIMGSLPVRKGAIRFHEKPISGKKPFEIVQLGLSLAPEGRHIYKDMTVWDNLSMGAYPKRGRKHMEQTRSRVFSLFPILEKRKDQIGSTLSGGEQQMLTIGRALMSEPELLLIDELSLGLAPLITREIYRILDELTDMTILYVEQNVDLALRHARRAYIMESGRITRSGLSKDLMGDAEIRRAYLGM
ncbi:ABC transporter ATP-binding protein [Desulfatirhabdium butyrativorans]|uniref:ABC transporter ATP-binding protein n=1 Tax=Desulfatirhabdium butyrativorans TaxID=340467 RepID=UPI0004034EE0|nr:ABC transporter ATP-binding protein [Desulfatirhabdium butyrativorans]